MTQNEIIKDISWKTGIKQSDVKDIIQFYKNAMIDEIVACGRLYISNLGTFNVKERDARKGRNPRTGEQIEIAAHKTVTFKASPYLNENIQ